VLAKIWIKVNDILKTKTTSHSLLQAHFNNTERFSINLDWHKNELLTIKNEQGKKSDELAEGLLSDTLIPAEALDKDLEIIEKTYARN
jgi:hypothetical protein